MDCTRHVWKKFARKLNERFLHVAESKGCPLFSSISSQMEYVQVRKNVFTCTWTTIHVLISRVCSNKLAPYGLSQFRPESEQVSTFWPDSCRRRSSLAFRFVSWCMFTVQTPNFKKKNINTIQYYRTSSTMVYFLPHILIYFSCNLLHIILAGEQLDAEFLL
jgi:hypothetical protein